MMQYILNEQRTVEELLRWLRLRGNLCVQWIKTDKLELGREAACDLAAAARQQQCVLLAG